MWASLRLISFIHQFTIIRSSIRTSELLPPGLLVGGSGAYICINSTRVQQIMRGLESKIIRSQRAWVALIRRARDDDARVPSRAPSESAAVVVGCRRQEAALGAIASQHGFVLEQQRIRRLAQLRERVLLQLHTGHTRSRVVASRETTKKSETARARMGAQPTEMANDARSTRAHCTTRSELDASLTSSPRRGSARDGRDGRCRGKGSHLGHLVLGQLEAVAHFIARL